MNEKPYPFKKIKTEFRYEFVSISESKEVKKIVVLTETKNEDIYNLALLDVVDDETVSDISETKNKDMNTVMATVISIIGDFLNEHPQKLVLFRGSDDRRQRLYRIIISRELEVIKRSYNIFGQLPNKVEVFEIGKTYTAYIIGKR